MKAIIPVAGAGTKLRPHTYTQPKSLIPIAGKPILSHIVDQILEAGINEFIFIIGHMGEKVQEYIKQTYPDLICHFVYQNERHGTGPAIALTQALVGNDEIFVVLGDTICEYEIQEVLHSPHSMLGVKKVDDPRHFGVAEIDEDNFIQYVEEKPSIPRSNTALVGIYKIKETTQLFECLHKISSQENKIDFSLTEAIECMLKQKIPFQSFKVKHWYDCGKKESLLESNATLLKKAGNFVHENVHLAHAIIIPPVSIQSGCTLHNTIIGPHVAIGANTHLQNAVIKNSIIGSYATLQDIILNNSLIGSDSNVKGFSRSLNIGDNTEIEVG